MTEIPRDGRTLTLYRQRRNMAWYVVWQEGQVQRSRCLGKTLPSSLQRAYDQAKRAQAELQTAIRVAFPQKAEVQG